MAVPVMKQESQHARQQKQKNNQDWSWGSVFFHNCDFLSIRFSRHFDTVRTSNASPRQHQPHFSKKYPTGLVAVFRRFSRSHSTNPQPECRLKNSPATSSEINGHPSAALTEAMISYFSPHLNFWYYNKNLPEKSSREVYSSRTLI